MNARPGTPRVVSLLPATTEVVAALGDVATLVGRSHECDHPAEVGAAPVITEPRTRLPDTSAGIHRSLSTLATDLLSIYVVHGERLRAADPDLIITQSLCAVCAVDESVVRDAVAHELDREVAVLSLAPSRCAEVCADVERIGAAIDDAATATEHAGAAAPGRPRHRADGASRRATALAASMRDGLERLTARHADRARPRVAVLEWLEPLMGAGNWMPELVAAAGGVPVLGEAGAHSPWTDLAAVAALDPDVVVLAPCGFTLDRTRAEVGTLAADPTFRALRAVRTGRIALADGHHYFNRPGPRLVDSAEILAEILHPDAAPARHRGRGWEPWSPPAVTD